MPPNYGLPEHITALRDRLSRDIDFAYWRLYCAMLDISAGAGALPRVAGDSQSPASVCRSGGERIANDFQCCIARCGGRVSGAVRRARQGVALHHLVLAQDAGLDLTATSASHIARVATGQGLSRSARARFSTPLRNAGSKTPVIEALDALHGDVTADKVAQGGLLAVIKELLEVISTDRHLLDQEANRLRELAHGKWDTLWDRHCRGHGIVAEDAGTLRFPAKRIETFAAAFTTSPTPADHH